MFALYKLRQHFPKIIRFKSSLPPLLVLKDSCFWGFLFAGAYPAKSSKLSRHKVRSISLSSLEKFWSEGSKCSFIPSKIGNLTTQQKKPIGLSLFLKILYVPPSLCSLQFCFLCFVVFCLFFCVFEFTFVSFVFLFISRFLV